MNELETNALLEIQYLAMQELMDELKRTPTRDEVMERLELIVKKGTPPSLHLVN